MACIKLVLEQVFLLWCLTQGCDIYVMARRWWRNTDSVDVESELAELRQSNQALQQMMNEIIHRIPASPNQSQGSVYVLLQYLIGFQPLQIFAICGNY